MTVTVSIETVKTILGLITALAAVAAIIWKGFKWLNKQGEQSEEIESLKEENTKLEEKFTAMLSETRDELLGEIHSLREHHDKDIAAINDDHEATIKAIQEEQTLVVYGLLACLKGLNEQGCDGPVSEAIDKMEKHINKRAHGQV